MYRKFYDNEGARLTLNADIMQLGHEDGSKEALAEKHGERSEPISCEETNVESGANRNPEDKGERVTVGKIEVLICNPGDRSKEPLNKNTREEKQLDSSSCVKTNEDAENLACSSVSLKISRNDFQETADGNENGCVEDEPDEDYFSAKDLLRFGWQIGRGMVSYYCRVTFEY